MGDIKDKLARVAALVAGWSRRGVVDEVERDMALTMMRDIYSAIKFREAAPAADAPVRRDPEPLPPIPPVDEPRAKPTAPVDQDPAPVTKASPKRRGVAPDVIRSLYGSDVEPEPEPAPEPETAPEPEPEPVFEPEPEPIFEPEPGPEPDEIAPDGEDCQAPEPEQEPESEIEPEPLSEPEPFSEPEPALEPEPDPEPKPAPEPLLLSEPKTTLGDALAARKTLGEILRNSNGDEAGTDRPTLKRSIGLNDRFLMIRDLFGGDAAAFDRAITQLESFTDLDEAVIWIRDSFDWSADNRGSTLLIGLLERKLGR